MTPVSSSDPDYDVVVTARVVIDDLYRLDFRTVDEIDIPRQLLDQIKYKMPDDWTLDDAVYSEFVTCRLPQRTATTYELKVYP